MFALTDAEIRYRRAGYPGRGVGAVAADGFAAGAGDLAGAVAVDGELPAQFVQDDVMVPPAVILEAGQAGVPAVGSVDHVVRFAAGRGLVAAARALAATNPERAWSLSVRVRARVGPTTLTWQ
jgi:hypothetical protein